MTLTIDPQRTAIARSSAVTFAGSAANAVLGLALVVVLGRALGDAGSGVVLQTVAVFAIALGVARLGTDSAALWILPRLDDENPAAIRPTARRLIVTAGIGGTVAALALAVGCLTAVDGELGAAMLAICAFLPAAAMLVTALAVTRALGDVVPFTVIGNVALPLARPIAIVIVAVAGGSVVAAAVAWAVPVVAALGAALAVLATTLLARVERPLTAAEYRRTGLVSRIRGYAAPRVVSESLTQLLIWLDVLVVGALAGPAAAGVYGAATRIATAGSLVDQAVRVVVSPLFSRYIGRSDHAALAGLFRQATRWLVLFSSPVYVLIAVFAPVALSVVGPDFVDGAPALAILAVGSVVTFLAGNIHSVLLMSGRSGLAAINKAIVVTLDVALLFVLVPEWGIVGAAIAWVIACAVDALIASTQVRMVLGLRLPLLAGVRPLVLSLATVGIAAIASRLVFGPTWLGLGVAVLVGGGALVLVARSQQSVLELDAFATMRRTSGTGARS